MNKFLASVTSAAEALTALKGGADIIDCKNPSTGALGALPHQTVMDIISAVNKKRPVSATIGDLPTEAHLLTREAHAMAETGVDYIKIGFFETEGLQHKLQHFTPPQGTAHLIAVLFADRQPPLTAIDQLAHAGFVGIMLDTAAKQQGNLLSYHSPSSLKDFVQQANRLGLISGLAGSLGTKDIPLLSSLGADYLGFRGALCHQDRTSGLSAERLFEVRQHLDHCITKHKIA